MYRAIKSVLNVAKCARLHVHTKSSAFKNVMHGLFASFVAIHDFWADATIVESKNKKRMEKYC
jgi:hypothetical protein